MKKILSIILALMLTFSMVAGVAAEEAATDKVYEMKAVDLSEFFADKDAWQTSNDKIEITDKKIVAKDDALAYFGMADEALKTGLVQFKAKMSYENSKGEAAWTGFSLRSSSPKAPGWTAGGYLFVIKSDRIELQVWRGGQKVLGVVPNTYAEHGETVEIATGVLDVNGGCNVFLFINGECVMNAFDAKGTITDEANLTFHAPYGFEISKSEAEYKLPTLPVAGVLSQEIAEEGLTYTYSGETVSFGGDAEDEFTVNWYYSPTEEGKHTELDESAKKEFTIKYICLGEYENLEATGDSYVAPGDKTGGYFNAIVTNKDGKAVYRTEAGHLAVEKYLDENSIALMLDCPNSYVKGTKYQIDENNEEVTPMLVNDRTMVPVRFIAERYEATVGWDDPTQTVTIELGGKTIKMVIDELKYTVDGEEKALDVPAQLINERTMVPVRVISEAFDKTVFWDGDNNLIIVYDNVIQLDVAAEKSYLSRLARRLDR